MKYLDEFSNPELAGKLIDQIRAATTRRWAIMEVCGGQTHSIIRHGIDQLLPDEIEMIHGPGCPVCVTPLEMIDKALEIASRPDVIFCSFGDMLRVPGSKKDLFRIKSEGGDVRVVYSPAGCADHRQGEPGPAGGVLRDRVRDHRPGQRHDRVPGQTPWGEELLAAGLARAGAAGDRRDHGIADLPGAGVPRRRSRLLRDGHRRIPGAHREVPDPDRGHRIRAARHPGGHPAHGDSTGIRPPRARERLSAGGTGGGQPACQGHAPGRLRGRRTGRGAASG